LLVFINAMTAAVFDFIECLKAVHPDLQDVYAELSDLYRKKLYHQLTLKIEDYVKLPQVQGQEEELVQFYNKFIKDFETKLNPLSLVWISVAIAKTIKDQDVAVRFLEDIAKKVKAEVQAHVLVLSVIADIRLQQRNLEQAKKTLEVAKEEVEKTAGIDSDVHASYYRVWANYYKTQNQAIEFYNHALKYLAYAQLDNIARKEQLELAFDLGIAALIGDSIYNFGELLGHDIVKALEDSPVAWLVQLLRVFNSGDVAGYEALIHKYQGDLSQQPGLVANQKLLNDKIAILALMELAFKRPSDQRTISFHDVAAASKVPTDQAEHLIMKALSLKLVKGTIDELDKTVTITWVQPRVLDIHQIAGMKDRLGAWTQKVQSTLVFMESAIAPEIFS